jgi:opacity protein-like surface antigen
MKKQSVAVAGISLLSLGGSLAGAQTYPYAPPPPPPPYYYAPPPPPPPSPYVPPPAPYVSSDSGPYFRMSGGPTFFETGTLQQFTTQGFSGPANQPVDFDVGYTFSGAFGYAFNKYLSLDFESGYNEARINNIPGYFANGSYISNIPLLVNGTLSLPIPHTILVPYIGVGGGGSISTLYANALGDQGGNFTAFGSISETVYAYQVFAGLNFKVTRNISLGIGYKYFGTGDTSYSYPPGPNLNISFKGVRTHTVMFTFQSNF